MSTSFLRWTAAALAGLAFAVAIGIAASTLASERIGLSSEPLSAGGELAPAAVKEAPKPIQPRKQKEPATPAPVSPPVAPAPQPAPGTEPADDSGHQEVEHESEPDHDGDD